MIKKIFENKKNLVIGLVVLGALAVGFYLSFKDRDMMLVSRRDFTATLLNDGKVLITGGSSGWNIFDSAEIYDPKTHKSRYTGLMNIKRTMHNAILLDDGRVLIVGALGKLGGQAEIYNPKTEKFTLTDKLHSNTVDCVINLLKLHDGNIFVFTSAITEIYNPKTNKFKVLGKPKFQHFVSALVELENNKILIIGRAINKIKEEKYIPKDEMNRYPIIFLPDKIIDFVKSDSGDKKITYEVISSTIYDLNTNQFTVGPKMIEAREHPKIVKLQDGKILVLSGNDRMGNPLKSAEIYDPKTNKFTNVGELNIPRRTGLIPVLLRNGNVYIAGNDYYPKNLKSFKTTSTCEIYNSEKQIFEFTDKCITTLKSGNIPIVLPDSKLLLFGSGKTDKQIRKIEIINTKGIK